MAYLVFHDGFDGSMEVWQERDLPAAQAKARQLQDRLDDMGYEQCGSYRAYEALPKRKVWKMHQREHWGGIAGEVGR